jgi:RecA-family ATPase
VKLHFFDECCNGPAKPWLIKGVIANDEDSLWVGAAGSLKSSLLTDIAVHLAAGIDWRGYKVKASAGVVYFAPGCPCQARQLQEPTRGRGRRYGRFD